MTKPGAGRTNPAGRMEGKRAVVTGAGRNVGRAIAELFATEGASVAVVDLDVQRGRATLDSLEQIRPGAGHFVPCNVAEEQSVEAMVNQAEAALGGIDVLVNCVAITDRPTDILELTAERWDAVVDTSLKSVFLCTKHVAQRMVKQASGGSIVNIGSTSGHRGRRNAVAYGAAKAAVLNLGMTCATQLGEYGIRVNTVTPNTVGSPVGEDVEPANRKRTNLLGRGCQPVDVANAVMFLASDEAGFVTASELLVDGGALHGSG